MDCGSDLTYAMLVTISASIAVNVYLSTTVLRLKQQQEALSQTVNSLSESMSGAEGTGVLLPPASNGLPLGGELELSIRGGIVVLLKLGGLVFAILESVLDLFLSDVRHQKVPSPPVLGGIVSHVSLPQSTGAIATTPEKAPKAQQHTNGVPSPVAPAAAAPPAALEVEVAPSAVPAALDVELAPAAPPSASVKKCPPDANTFQRKLEWMKALYNEPAAKDYTDIPMFQMPNLDLDAKQQSVVQALRSQFPESVHMHTDYDLNRFCIAREYKLPKVVEMYQKYLKVFVPMVTSGLPIVRPIHGDMWNLDYKGVKVSDYFEDRDPQVTGRLMRTLKCFNHQVIFGQDKEGHPVVYNRIASGVNKGLNEKETIEARLQYLVSNHEQVEFLAHIASARAGRPLFKCTVVMDSTDATATKSMEHARNPNTQKETDFASEFMPESLFKVIVVKAPWYAAAVFKIIKVFLDKRTTDKVKLYDSEKTMGTKKTPSALRQYIDADQLPKMYGGTAEFEWPDLMDDATYTWSPGG